MAKRAQCDCCAEMKLTVSQALAFGTETWACATCRGNPEDDVEAENEHHNDDSICNATNSSDLRYRMFLANRRS